MFRSCASGKMCAMKLLLPFIVAGVPSGFARTDYDGDVQVRFPAVVPHFPKTL